MSRETQLGLRSALAAMLVSLLLIGAFWPTVATMVQQWSDVETYSHGFLILPISLWLVWREREVLATIPHRPAPIALLFVFAAGLGWMLARLLGIQVVEQLAFVVLWIMALWAILGHALARRFWFPLFFLLTMVPMGDGLLPPMMEFTANFTVWMLELTGIPVYREGLSFVVPTGNWSVVEACSGVRYLIASVTLGLLFAHLTYHSIWRKLLFVLVSILMPILANGVRAYLIVMIGHLSNMKLAVGVDHLIYGWLFFGLVMLLLFWVGGLFVDQPPATPPQSAAPAGAGNKLPQTALVAVGVLAISLGLQSASASLSGENAAASPDFSLPAHAGDWQRSGDALDWPVSFPAADQIVQATYESQGRRVTLKLGLFLHQRQGHEVISTDNKLLARQRDGWRVTGHGGVTLSGERRPFYEISRERGFLVGSTLQKLHAATWYRLGDRETSNDYLGKYYQGLSLLTAGRTDGIYVVLATDKQVDSQAVLQRFASEALPSIWSAWDTYLQRDGRTE